MQNKSFGKNILQGIRSAGGARYSIILTGMSILVPLRKYFLNTSNPGRIRTHRLFGRLLSYYSPTELLHGLHEIFIDHIYKQQLACRAIYY